LSPVVAATAAAATPGPTLHRKQSSRPLSHAPPLKYRGSEALDCDDSDRIASDSRATISARLDGFGASAWAAEMRSAPTASAAAAARLTVRLASVTGSARYLAAHCFARMSPEAGWARFSPCCHRRGRDGAQWSIGTKVRRRVLTRLGDRISRTNDPVHDEINGAKEARLAASA